MGDGTWEGVGRGGARWGQGSDFRKPGAWRQGLGLGGGGAWVGVGLGGGTGIKLP